MSLLTWIDEPRTCACKVCLRSGPANAIAVINAYGQVGLEAVKCPACGSIDLLDEPLESSPTDASVDDYVEVGAGVAAIAAAFDHVDAKHVSRFLDVGCNYGFAMDIAQFVFGWQVMGVEPSLAGARGAAELGLRIVPGYLTASTDLGRPFDLILASEVLEHVPDPREFLAVLRTHLAERGTVILTTPAAEIVARSSAENDALAALSPGYHTFIASQAGLEGLLRDAGFAEVHIERAGGTLRATARVDGGHRRAKPTPITPNALRRYLRHRMATAPVGSSLAAGMAIRLVRELVASGEFDDAVRAAGHLFKAFHARHGIDLQDPHAILASLDAGTLPPWSSVGACFALGMLDLLHHDKPERAAAYFEATRRMAATWWERLQIVDLDTADLLFRGAYHQALAMTHFDPAGAAAVALDLGTQISHSAPDVFEVFNSSQCRILVELVARGHYAPATELAKQVEVFAGLTARDVEPEWRVAGLDALYSLGVLRGALGDVQGAQAAFVECIAVCDRRPTDDAHATHLAEMCRAALTPTREPTPIRARDRLRPSVTSFIDTYWTDAWGTYVAGWAHMLHVPVAEIRVETDAVSIIASRNDRPDLRGIWPMHKAVARSGFSAYLPHGGPATLRVVLTAEDGYQAHADLEVPRRPLPDLAAMPGWSPYRKLSRAISCATDGPVLALGIRSTSEEVFRSRVGILGDREIVGFDIHPGIGVDVVGDAHELSSLFPRNHFAVVYSEALLEHVTAPWIVAAECAKVLRTGGLAVHLAPWAWPTHAEPNDFWRFSEQGLASLFGERLGFSVIEAGSSGGTVMTPTPDWRLTQGRFPTTASASMSWVMAEKIDDSADAASWPYALADTEAARNYPVGGLSADVHSPTS